MARISLILTPGFADWEYAFIAGTASPFYGIDVRFFAPTTGQINSQGGLAVTIDSNLQQCLDWKPDVVAVIGGMVWESVEAPDIRDFLHASRSDGATIAGICGGTLALARAGLLDDIPHTSNSADFLQENAVSYEGHARYQNSRVAVVADRIITAPGPAPVSFTCAVFEGAGLSSEIISQFRSMLAAEHKGDISGR
ncbi:DJ-1/PfpI family protein [Pseudomonas sp. CCI3.1]|uniref:DJ-1/PfpI family protein n=1 Tax=Pseudomonas sp. CCI3.1 TaxID=3048618 RepID=UPI002AB5D4DA|nr:MULTISPECIES: DJ-1/PfpI family protein [unclassified Pseudomonas]MDY7580773.1 DJ-1/PfpI family protein [Pseudomonas sp. CCI3.1]MEB0065893.1 DJ-1/PfpI family protein [Pseudomonas sp. CCI3.1]MEB0070766.1 DJ-1/PfpI family protein [Pseudomonas sp. CCI1.4]